MTNHDVTAAIAAVWITWMIYIVWTEIKEGKYRKPDPEDDDWWD